jgi:uncharacterized protein YndB with AHSA1/START domain
MSASKFFYVTFIRTTPQKLWQALVDPAFTRQYWCEARQVSDWKKGSPWKLVAPTGKVADAGEIVEIDPPKKLVLTWQNHLIPEATAEGFSRMTYEIEPVGDSVKLTLTHEIDRPDSKLIEAVSGGWPHILASLKSLLETGKPLAETTKWPEQFR